MNMPIPQINIKEQNQQFNIPATDHPVVVQNFAYGKLATLNIWCPDSPVSPSISKALIGSDGFKLTNPDSHITQMKVMARYITDCFKSGVTLLSLQEIPKVDTVAFGVLESELRNIAAVDSSIKINIDDLKKIGRQQPVRDLVLQY